ncbi:MAG: hypothetical protein IJ031_09025 [Oscillospiraceae bacterium]|nr:hypothetical protein [Oscillospiraceae bacterium]
MNTATSKIIRALIIIVVLVFFVAKVYESFKDNYDTEEAVSYNVNENIVFDGVFVRNETIITHDTKGVIDYLYPDGSKLSNSSVIANVYENEQQIYAKYKIQELYEELDDLEHSQNPGTTNYAQPETIKSQIDEKYLQITSAIEVQDLKTVASLKNELVTLMNIYNIVTKTETDYEERKAEINKQIESYQTQYALPISTIETDSTGYFVSKTDGFENKISIDTIDSVNIEMIEDIIDGKDADKVDNAVGKLYDSYECKIVGIIKPTNKFLKGDSLRIRLGSSELTYSVDVYDIIKESDEKWIVILNCEAIDENISSERVEKIELIFKEFTGLKVPREAIRFKEFEEKTTDENGLETKTKVKYKGVYVQIGQEVTFKKINVIYEGDNFVICENVSDTDYLNLYDQIILEEVSKDDS